MTSKFHRIPAEVSEKVGCGLPVPPAAVPLLLKVLVALPLTAAELLEDAVPVEPNPPMETITSASCCVGLVLGFLPVGFAGVVVVGTPLMMRTPVPEDGRM